MDRSGLIFGLESGLGLDKVLENVDLFIVNIILCYIKFYMYVKMYQYILIFVS